MAALIRNKKSLPIKDFQYKLMGDLKRVLFININVYIILIRLKKFI